MEGFTLSPSKVKQLKLLHKKQRDRRAADKIKAIVLLGTGWTLSSVSEALLLDTETLRSYVKKYREGKIDEVVKLKYEGRKSNLSNEAKLELQTYLSKNTYPDVKSIIFYVKSKYGVLYKSTGMRNILKELGFVYKKPKLIPNTTNPVEVIAFLQRYEKIRRSKKPLYFMDGVHPQYNSRPSHGWILRGETKALLSNTGRKRININGAINIDTKKIITNINESINAQSTISLFKKILKDNKNEKKVYIVCDNAGYYRGKLVKNFLEKNKKIEIVFLPSYSPFLNLIERLWKYFNKIVLYNKYYAKFSEFKEACLKFFKRSHKRVLDKKLVEKFHISDQKISSLVYVT